MHESELTARNLHLTEMLRQAGLDAEARGIPFKLEVDVERAFRHFCRGDDIRVSGRALFCRSAEKAGEVWALDAGYTGVSEASSQE